MATKTLPTNVDFNKARIKYRRNTAMNMSPYTYKQQVFSWAGQLLEVEFSLPSMKQEDADDWLNFFDELNGYENTFIIDLTRFYPNQPSLSAVEMRLADPDQIWDLNTDLTYGINFTAIEAK